MSNKVCFIYTNTNGLHNTDEFVSKKNMFEFARLIELKYSIGYYDSNNKYIEEIKEKLILKPTCINFNKKAQDIHKISYDKADTKGKNNIFIMNKFKNDLKNVSIIIGHNLNFHIKAIQVELFRTYTYIDFNNYILVDLLNLNYNNTSLINLAKKYNINTEKYKDLKLIKKLFIPIYNDYIK